MKLCVSLIEHCEQSVTVTGGLAAPSYSMCCSTWIIFYLSSTVQVCELIYAHLPRVRDYYAFHCTLFIRVEQEHNDQLLLNSLSFHT